MYTYVAVHTQRSGDNLLLLPCLNMFSFFLLCMPDYLGYNLPADPPVSASHHAVGVLGFDVHTVLPASI